MESLLLLFIKLCLFVTKIELPERERNCNVVFTVRMVNLKRMDLGV